MTHVYVVTLLGAPHMTELDPEYEEFQKWKAKRGKIAPAVPLPAPLVLTSEQADKAASLKRLIDGVDVVVGVLNGTVHAANNQFWQEAKAHHNLNTDAFVWSVEDGVLMPSPKPLPSPVPTG